MVPGLKSRTSWIFCLAGIIAVGILSRVVHTGLLVFDKYLGDALYAAMVSAILRLFWRAAARARLAVSAMAIMTVIELFQLTMIPAHLLANGHVMVRICAPDRDGVQLPGSAHVRGGHRVHVSRGFFECVKGQEDSRSACVRTLPVAGVFPLFQEVFNTLGVEHTYAQFFEIGRRSASQSLFGPSRNRAEALFDNAAKDCEFALLQAPLVLAAQHSVV